MKRYICLAIVCLILLLPVRAMAQTEPALALSVSYEDTIYLTVALEGGVEGTSLGVTGEIDDLLLESVPSASKWKVEGLLSDFNDRGQGVWTTDKPRTLEGDIVVLAFRARSAEPFETKVTCTLIVKNGAQEVGRYTAQTTVAVKGSASVPTEATVPAPTQGKPDPQPTGETTQGTAPQTVTSAPTEAVTAAPTDAAAAETDAVTTASTETLETPADTKLVWWALPLAAVGAAAAGFWLYSKKSKK